MKRTPVLLLDLILLAGGALWYSAARTERVRIRRMAEESPHSDVLRDGNMEERPLVSPCGE